MQRQFLLTALACATGAIHAAAQQPETFQSKLNFHINAAYGPEAMLGIGAWAGILQAEDSPREWGQGSVGYGKRFVSTMAYSGVRNALALGLDTSLHQDPRYYRSGRAGFLSRTMYVLHSTLFTRKDSGGETLSTWRIGSAYSAAFIANEWRPDRVNTVARSLEGGTAQLGFDVLTNLGSEFWPDIRRKLGHR